MDSQVPDASSAGISPDQTVAPDPAPVPSEAESEVLQAEAGDPPGDAAPAEAEAEAVEGQAAPVAPGPVPAGQGRARASSRASTGRLWAAAEARRAAEAEAGGEGQSDGADAGDEAVEEAEQVVLADLATLAAERDDYLDQLRRTKADFENYRKRIIRQQTEHLERAAEGLAEKLLPVLDTFEAAIAHGQGFEQVHAALMSTLEKEGLERIDPEGKPFDPAESDAVAHEEGEDGPVVTEVLRSGYRWKGRVLRPAMVKVRG